jgi:hypothetical protein
VTVATTRRLGALLLLAVVAGCGYDPPSDVVQPASATDSAPPPTTTTVPPGGRQPTPDDPLRVVFAGDSVMADLAPAAVDGLVRGGASEAAFVLSPGVALDPSAETIWRRQLETVDPDVIVVLVGTWETGGQLGEPGTAGWRARYDAEVLDPFVELVTSGGAQLIWVGMPAVVDALSTFQLGALNEAYASLPERFDQVTYIAGGDYVSAPTGGYAEVLEGPEGPVRVRRVDGLHLCPEGATRIAEPIFDALVADWNVPVAEDWRDGDWRRPPQLVKPEECPPV